MSARARRAAPGPQEGAGSLRMAGDTLGLRPPRLPEAAGRLWADSISLGK